MAVHTRFSTLSLDEFLSQIDDNRHRSPIIQELCMRLEATKLEINTTNHRAECPVCEAQLTVDYDDGNNLFTVEVPD